MRKLYQEEARSWVFLLPLAIRMRHDTIDPELGFSPYQLVFGRDRPGMGLPWGMACENLEAKAWFAKREQEDLDLGLRLRRRILDELRRVSKDRKDRRFQKGDRVWMKRFKGITGPGLHAVWQGPYFISKQVGDNSFEIVVGKEDVAVHASQLKICVEVGDKLQNPNPASDAAPKLMGTASSPKVTITSMPVFLRINSLARKNCHQHLPVSNPSPESKATGKQQTSRGPKQ